jgi:hypothetical protein
LKTGDAAIAVATKSHLRQLLLRLRSTTRSVDRAVEQGSYLQLDANELVSHVLADGVCRVRPLLMATIESARAATTRVHARVAVFGEFAALLSAAGHIDVALEVEALGVHIVRTMSAAILCVYPLSPTAHDGNFKPVCAHHDAIAIR